MKPIKPIHIFAGLCALSFFGTLTFDILHLGPVGKGSRWASDYADCFMFSKNEADLPTTQRYLRRAKSFFHSREEIEAYRQDVCTRVEKWRQMQH